MNRCPKRHDDHYKKMFVEDENRSNFEKKYISETISKKNDYRNFFQFLLSRITRFKKF